MKNIIPAIFLSVLVCYILVIACSSREVEPIENTSTGTNNNGNNSNQSMNITRYGKKLVYFAEVDKAGDYFRRMFIDSASAVSVKSTGNIPDGAIIVMETWFGSNQSTVFARQKINGQWQSTSFSPSSPNYNFSLEQSCNGCHSTASSTDHTYTKPLLIKALAQNVVQTINCNQPSFTPCDLSVYQGN